MTFGRAELLRYMRGHRLAVLSSIGPDGDPQSALVGIAVSAHCGVIFDTTTNSRKHGNLVRDPRASIVFAGPDEQTLQLEGLARPIGLGNTADAELRAAYYEVWADGPSRLSWPNLAYWCIGPRWARYSDFLRGPLIQEFRW